MADWTVSMNEEKETNPLLKTGWHEAKILNVRLVSEQESKSKNPYFTWFLTTKEGNIEMRTTLLKGKRWLLKQTLEACGITAKEDDQLKKYSFSKGDVVNKTVSVNVINKTSNFINNSGEPVSIEKSEINRVKKATPILTATETKISSNDDFPF